MLPPIMNKEETLALPWPFLRVRLVHMDTAILNQVFIQILIWNLYQLLYCILYFFLIYIHIFQAGCCWPGIYIPQGCLYMVLI